jgi:hypothetical protein
MEEQPFEDVALFLLDDADDRDLHGFTSIARTTPDPL